MTDQIKVIVVVVFSCVIIRLFCGEPCYIPSESMEPTLCTGDWVWLDKASYGALFPNCFADIPLLNVFTWIKPLRVADARNNWKSRRFYGFRKPEIRDVIVFRSPQNRNVLLVKRVVRKAEHDGVPYYYVMGDNRDNSLDSRSFGEIPESLVVGRIKWVLFSKKDSGRIFKSIE